MFINQATECQAPSYRDRRLARMAFFNVFSFFKRIFVTKKKEKFTRFLLLMLLWLLGCFLSCLKSLKWSSTTFCTTSHQITSHITKSHCFLARFFFFFRFLLLLALGLFFIQSSDQSDFNYEQTTCFCVNNSKCKRKNRFWLLFFWSRCRSSSKNFIN